jgi:hypothetical protein
MKADLRAEIKALRFQMAKLEKSCKEREDKVIKVCFILEPFLAAFTPEQNKKIMDEIDRNVEDRL